MTPDRFQRRDLRRRYSRIAWTTVIIPETSSGIKVSDVYHVFFFLRLVFRVNRQYTYNDEMGLPEPLNDVEEV